MPPDNQPTQPVEQPAQSTPDKGTSLPTGQPTEPPAQQTAQAPGQASQSQAQPAQAQQGPPAEKKYCVQCSAEMQLNFKGEWFCPKCGFKMEVATPKQLSPEELKKQRIRTIVKISAYVVFGIFAIFALWFFFKKFDEMMNLF